MTQEDYEDIINLPHPEPQAHVRMPLTARAAQFMPFAALKDDGDENIWNDSEVVDQSTTVF